MEICFVLDYYPTKYNNGCVFVKHLIKAIADQGHKCIVICPQIFMPDNFKKENKMPAVRREKTAKGNTVVIYAPYYLHLSSRKQTIQMSMDNHYRAVLSIIRKNHLHPDVVYGHFIYQNGLTAARLGKTLGIPSFCAVGENSLRLVKGSKPYATGLQYANWKSILTNLTGIISVSGYNKQLLLENGFVDENMPIGIFPNSIDKHKFFITDKQKARKKLGFPQDAFIVAFVGQFKASKGVAELCGALKQCKGVSSIFMGAGPMPPEDDSIIFCGKVPNDKVHIYLNAADVFVLPTKGEGCSNAIIEALACGLPVISADLPFNKDVLTSENSILVDVEKENEIAEAITLLQHNPELKNKLSTGAAKTAVNLDINTRAKNILEFMTGLME